MREKKGQCARGKVELCLILRVFKVFMYFRERLHNQRRESWFDADRSVMLILSLPAKAHSDI